MGRQRSARNRNLPRNLYERRGYFAWRDPRDGKEYGLGTDKQSAIDQAIEANLLVSGQYSPHRLVDRLTGNADRTFGDWHQRYLKVLADRGIKPKSIVAASDQLRAAYAKWETTPVANISVMDVADFLKAWTDAGKVRMAAHVLSRLRDMFREAIVAGWIESNPAEATKVHGVKTKRERLTLNQYQAILAQSANDARRKWLPSMLKLALLTGQRREDLATFEFDRDVREGRLWLEQGKTGQKLALSLDLRLAALPQSLGEVIEECRSDGMRGAKTILHHRAFAGTAKPGEPLRNGLLSRAFADTRDELELDWGEHPPTLHEIRSLAGRLYAEAYGAEFAQALLGHRNAQTTAVYLDVRRAEYITVITPIEGFRGK
ncbi:tyrosine-type recombinase/integrase [Chitinimonas taiwanensis]|uniref:tyrosine-type recombinase/integrase n=1 Tax=Chitinimonas taiwanensis TaxID=240412 RepID=UPI0035B1FAC4